MRHCRATTNKRNTTRHSRFTWRKVSSARSYSSPLAGCHTASSWCSTTPIGCHARHWCSRPESHTLTRLSTPSSTRSSINRFATPLWWSTSGYFAARTATMTKSWANNMWITNTSRKAAGQNQQLNDDWFLIYMCYLINYVTF